MDRDLLAAAAAAGAAVDATMVDAGGWARSDPGDCRQLRGRGWGRVEERVCEGLHHQAPAAATRLGRTHTHRGTAGLHLGRRLADGCAIHVVFGAEDALQGSRIALRAARTAVPQGRPPAAGGLQNPGDDGLPVAPQELPTPPCTRISA